MPSYCPPASHAPFTLLHRLLLAGCCAAFCAGAQAAAIRALEGAVQIQRGSQELAAAVGTKLEEGDEIKSLGGTEAVVRMDDGARLAVRPDSRVQLRELQVRDAKQPRTTIKLLQGGLRYVSAKSGPRHHVVTFETSTSTIGIRGTDIELAVTAAPVNNEPAGTYLKVNSGRATLRASDGVEVNVAQGQLAFGCEPELTPRGVGMPRRPAARRVESAPGGVFGSARLDRLMK